MTEIEKLKEEKRKELEHELLLAEGRWLLACGWTQEGFVWTQPDGTTKFTQDEAVARQKASQQTLVVTPTILKIPPS